MKTETLLQKLETVARQRNLEKFSVASSKWFREKTRSSVIKQNKTTLQTNILKQQKKVVTPKIGDMLCFGYDALHKDTLPYFDMFPLIILVNVHNDGFQGLNLHYLPPKIRAIFFDRLLDISNNKKFDDTTKIKLTYNLLIKSTKFKLFKPCFKKYLFSQIETRLVKIEPDSWEPALYLPIASFNGATQSKVWSDSLGKI